MIKYYKIFDLEPIHYTNQFGQPCVEQWVPIKDYEGLYEISNLGRLKSFCRWGNWMHKGDFYMKVQLFNKKGYLISGLSKEQKQTKKSIHRLVALHFIPNPDNLPQVNHNSESGDKTDNRFWMLQWCTNDQNREHAIENGLYFKGLKGESHYLSKLTEKEVLEIRELQSTKTRLELCAIYNVSVTAIRFIQIRKTWTHI